MPQQMQLVVIPVLTDERLKRLFQRLALEMALVVKGEVGKQSRTDKREKLNRSPPEVA